MTTIINCPSCDRGLQLPESLAGQAVQCPTCGHTFTATANGSSAAPIYRRDDVEPPPSRRPSPPPPHEEDYLDEPPSRPRRREKPGKVQAILDARNLLDQCQGSQHTQFGQYPRLLKGGINIRF